MKMKVKITLLSDTCLSSGDTLAGVVDTEIAADSYGIPMIQGKRLKGLFHEAALELMEFDMVSQEIVDGIFGRIGENRTDVVFETLYPEHSEKLKDFLKHARKDKFWKLYQEREKVLEYFTVNRIQTAIQEDGTAQENSLRMLHAVKKNLTFIGYIDFGFAIRKEQETLMKQCASMIRHIGLNRTRGMGNVYCEIDVEAAKNPEIKEKTEKFSDAEEVIPVHFYLEQPCVLEQNYIAGNVLRGIYTAAFLRREKQDGKMVCNLHENKQFWDLFLGNQVKYGYCWPFYENTLFEPVPYSFLKEKKQDTDEFYDLASCEQDEIDDFLEEKESCSEEFINLFYDEYGEMQADFYSVKRAEQYHHRRPKNRSIGHAAGGGMEKKSTADGLLYTMEALKEEQEFHGEIRGSKKLLEELKELLPEGSICYLGASRNAQYGKAILSYEIKVSESEADEADNAVITLLSPMIAEDEMGNPSTAATDVLKLIFPEGEARGKEIRCFCREERQGSYNRKWNMPIPERNILLPGSVIVVYNLDLPEEKIEKLNRTSFGLYQNEGYGRIRVNWHGFAEKGTMKEKDSPDKNERMPFYTEEKNPGLVRDYIQYCLRDMLEESFREENDTVYKLHRHLRNAPNSHMLSSIQHICRISNSFAELGKQISNASEREVDKDTKWYGDFLYILGANKNVLSEDSNTFIHQGMQEINAQKGLKEEWKTVMQKFLKEEGYRIFQKLFLEMAYEVHLEKSFRRKRYE